MRQDMAKVIVERPRLGGRYKYRQHRRELKCELDYALRKDNEDCVTPRESIRGWAVRNHEGKELNENLSPLRRFMLSRVGKVWDDVFSEICKVMDARSACQNHIWQHAVDYVETKTFVHENGEIWYSPRYSYRSYNHRNEEYDGDLNRPIKDSYAVVYVDPCDGTLQAVPTKPRYRHNNKITHDYVVIDKYLQAHRIHGFWYMIELADIPRSQWHSWSKKEVMEFELHKETKEACFLYGERANYFAWKRNPYGRWVDIPYQDVASQDIHETFKAERNASGAKYHFYMDSIKIKDLYGREGVYAKRRWQMNTAEMRRYGVKQNSSEEPELIR
jgi:hypothetical protein